MSKKECKSCKKELKKDTNFYSTSSPMFPDGRVDVCKKCISNMIDNRNIETVYNVLRTIDKPFLSYVWDEYSEEDNQFGKYIRQISSLPQYKNFSWSDSDIGNNSKTKDENENVVIQRKQETVITDDIIVKWGEGYSPEEYRSFERKYHMLKNNYQEKTAMHTEALLTYIRYRVKEELATANGNVKDAKDWGALAQKAAQDAKINPSQLSKSDLSDGLDTFGQLVRTVEQAVDIIPILPKFKKRPHDSIDFALLCYINYVRDLKSLPPAEYEDIYRFYEERKKEYADRYDFLKEDDENG